MTLLEAVVLGVVQGLTEPLPISSSAHLVIVPALIPGFRTPGVAFDVFLHLGTLFAVIFFLRREVEALLVSLLPEKTATARSPEAGEVDNAANRRMVLWLAIATFLTGTIGILFKETIETLFESVETTAFMLLITGTALFLSDRVTGNRRGAGEMNLEDGIVLGLVQAAALVPGISRSGLTITLGIFRGLERKTSATFSFLLSIPAIAGAVVLKSGDLLRIPTDELPALGVGFLAAAITGFLALTLLFAMINKTGLRPFAYYCWFVGTATLIARQIG